MNDTSSTTTPFVGTIRETAGDPKTIAREAFDKQSSHRWDMARTTANERIARLERLRKAIRQHTTELRDAVHADFGKAPTEMEITEILPTLEELGHVIKHLSQWMRPHRVPTPLTLAGATSEIRYEPKGLVLVLSPWNYPFSLSMNPVVAAIAAGNCVILRPSEKTPRTAAMVRTIISESLPPEEATVLIGGRELADSLLDLPFDHIFFTGSPSVGRKVMASAAKHLASVTLELGGKSPVVVDKSARVEAAAERIAWGKFVNAGQTCVAPDYVLVHEQVATAFVASLKASIERSYGIEEEGRLAGEDLCGLVDDAAMNRLTRALESSIHAGAYVEIGGKIDPARRRMTPTVLTGVTPDSPIMSDEIFGPILPVLTYRDLGEATRLIRSRPKPLALYVFAEAADRIERILESTTAGGTCVNNVLLHYVNPNLPFGGVGESGMGSYHGRHGFEAMSHARGVLRQRLPPGARLLYPPYAGRGTMLALFRKLVG